MVVDPQSGDLLIISKNRSEAADQGVTHVYRARAPLACEAPLECVATLRFGKGPLARSDRRSRRPDRVTGADLSADGRKLVIRTYDDAFIWDRPRHITWAEVLCGSDVTPRRLALKPEQKGEAVGWTLDGKGFVTLSEGKRTPIHLYTDSK
jgi:hypothetical protein